MPTKEITRALDKVQQDLQETIKVLAMSERNRAPSPIQVAIRGMQHAGASRYNKCAPDELRSWLGRDDISDSAIKIVEMFDESSEPRLLASAVQKLHLPMETTGDAMRAAERRVQYLDEDDLMFGYEYLPNLIEDTYPDGEIYISEDSSVDAEKARAIWAENKNNAIITDCEDVFTETLGFTELEEFEQ